MNTLPPKSILTNTSDILFACEEAELSPATNQAKFVLVTELAALLHLNEHTHARHLWHRYCNNENSSSSTGTNDDDDMIQFQMLWKAVEPLLKASLIAQIPDDGIVPAQSSGEQQGGGGVVPIPSSSLSSGHSEYYKRLQANIETKLEPLSTFSGELIQSQRIKMVRLLEKTYDALPATKTTSTAPSDGSGDEDIIRNYLGYVNNDNETEMNEFLKQRNWTMTSDNQFWIPSEVSLMEENERSDVVTSSHAEDKVQFLTNIVGFMEGQRVNK